MAKAQILLLGLYHFDNPNLDAFNMATDDVLAANRQAEIKDVVKKLAAFKPTKLAIEQPLASYNRINELYQDFCKTLDTGGETERRNEIFQIGFRLAHRLKHQEVFCIDVRQDMNFEPVMQFANENGQAEIIQKAFAAGQKATEEFAERQSVSTIGEMLRWFNTAEMLRANHSFYIDLLQIGNAPDYVGVQLVADWYARNLRIFNELTKIAEEDSRILVIFGQGHIPIIRQAVEDSNYLDLVDPLLYL